MLWGTPLEMRWRMPWRMLQEMPQEIFVECLKERLREYLGECLGNAFGNASGYASGNASENTSGIIPRNTSLHLLYHKTQGLQTWGSNNLTWENPSHPVKWILFRVVTWQKKNLISCWYHEWSLVRSELFKFQWSILINHWSINICEFVILLLSFW